MDAVLVGVTCAMMIITAVIGNRCVTYARRIAQLQADIENHREVIRAQHDIVVQAAAMQSFDATERMTISFGQMRLPLPPATVHTDYYENYYEQHGRN